MFLVQKKMEKDVFILKRGKLYLVLIIGLIASLLAACNGEASGDDTSEYPNGTITMVVPFSAGGAGDIMTREIARIAEDIFGERVVVDNKPGGSGSIALNHTLKQKPDGLTIMNHSSTLPQTMASGEIPFETDDILPVATIVSNVHVIAVKSNSPFETFEDFATYAKENPGELDVVGANTNGANHVFALKVMEGADIDFNYVAYDGGGEALTRLLGENGDAISTSGENIDQQVDAGEVRILAVSSPERVPMYPDVPTFKELGIENLDNEIIWRGFFVHPDTPTEIVEKIQDVLKQVTETEEFAAYAKNSKQDILFTTGEELQALYRNYYEDGLELLGKDN